MSWVLYVIMVWDIIALTYWIKSIINAYHMKQPFVIPDNASEFEKRSKANQIEYYTRRFRECIIEIVGITFLTVLTLYVIVTR